MTNCVKETMCTHCVHRQVCSIKTIYLDTLKKLPNVSSDFTVSLSCRYYLKDVPDPRTNAFTYDGSANGTLIGRLHG